MFGRSKTSKRGSGRSSGPRPVAPLLPFVAPRRSREPAPVALLAKADAAARKWGSRWLARVAEGVELESQAEKLRRLECDELQGFLFSPAVPAGEFSTLLQAMERKP